MHSDCLESFGLIKIAAGERHKADTLLKDLCTSCTIFCLSHKGKDADGTSFMCKIGRRTRAFCHGPPPNLCSREA